MDSMNTAVTPPAPSQARTVTSRDRLGFTLFIAAVLHALLILGITFDLPTPSELTKSLEITLATQRDDEAPEEADYLAQINQQGSGTLEEKAAPSTTEEDPRSHPSAASQRSAAGAGAAKGHHHQRAQGRPGHRCTADRQAGASTHRRAELQHERPLA